MVKAVDGLSYNQLVERIINNKTSSDSDLINQSLVAQNFLEESASQLTYHGLCELVSTMKDNELAIFFRNNHFSTLYKHKNVSCNLFVWRYHIIDYLTKKTFIYKYIFFLPTGNIFISHRSRFSQRAISCMGDSQFH